MLYRANFLFQETDTGLYVSLKSFLGLGRDYVEKHFHKTGEAVYLHIKRVRHEVRILLYTGTVLFYYVFLLLRSHHPQREMGLKRKSLDWRLELMGALTPKQ